MDSPRSGSLNKAVELLRVETDKFDLFIKGKPFHPTVETLQLHRDEEKQWADSTLEVIPISQRLQVSKVQFFSPVEGELVDREGARVYPCFYEHQDYQVVIQKKQPDTLVEFYHDDLKLRQSVESLNDYLLTGILNFRNEVGYTDFEICLNGQPCLQVRFEIFPSKMDYKKDYESILADVNETIHNLAFDFMQKTYNTTSTRQTSGQSLTEFWSMLRQIFQQLTRAVERIQTTPHHLLQKENRVMEADRVKRPGRENVAFLSKRPQLLQKDTQHGVLSVKGELYRPSKMIETRRRISYDTAENRFVRWALLRINTKLKEMKKHLQREHFRQTTIQIQTNADHITRIDRMQSQLNRLLRLDFLQEVGEMRQMSVTLVLQMASGYRDVYRMYLLLQKGLSLQGDLFRLSLKDVAELYEYWCFLKIHDLLRKKYPLVKQDILRVNRNGLFVKLDKSQAAKVVYRNPNNGEEFILTYNSKPPESKDIPTVQQKPDNVLALKKKDTLHGKPDKEYKYVFDAKYRINPAEPGTYYYNQYKTPGPQEEDINTMHRYRDAIVFEDHEKHTFERSMFGAFVLFPYYNEQEYENHHFYQSIKKVNVGAFPFLPNSTELMEKFLDELILDSPEKAFERSTQPRGSHKYYEDKLRPQNVLVGSLRSKEQWEFCFEGHFYYMPLRSLHDQKVLTQLEWVAIYQSKTLFGEKRCGIRYKGRIAEWRVVRRGEITEVAPRRGTEDQLYLRFHIAEWIPLDNVIRPGGRGVYHCWLTSQYMLERAEELAELRLETEEQLAEWREKRRIGHVRVELDHENIDQANQVIGIEVES